MRRRSAGAGRLGTDAGRWNAAAADAGDGGRGVGGGGARFAARCAGFVNLFGWWTDVERLHIKHLLATAHLRLSSSGWASIATNWSRIATAVVVRRMVSSCCRRACRRSGRCCRDRGRARPADGRRSAAVRAIPAEAQADISFGIGSMAGLLTTTTTSTRKHAHERSQSPFALKRYQTV